MKSQMASPTFTPVFAGLVSVVNTKFPEIGELLMQRLILQVSFPWPRVTRQRRASHALVFFEAAAAFAVLLVLSQRVICGSDSVRCWATDC